MKISYTRNFAISDLIFKLRNMKNAAGDSEKLHDILKFIVTVFILCKIYCMKQDIYSFTPV